MEKTDGQILAEGMECLLSKMDAVDAARFIFLVKTEVSDYTEWQREYFGSMTKEDIDSDMDRYFEDNPFNGVKNLL